MGWPQHGELDRRSPDDLRIPARRHELRGTRRDTPTEAEQPRFRPSRSLRGAGLLGSYRGSGPPGRQADGQGLQPGDRHGIDLLQLFLNREAVEAGKGSLPAVASADRYLLKHPRAVTIEWPVDDALARQVFEDLQPTGAAGPLGHPGEYSARPRIAGCTASNCGLWATREVEEALGGRVGRAGAYPVTDIGSKGVHAPGTGGQGQIMALFEDAAKAGRAGRPSPLAPMPGASGGAVASGMPMKWRVLKAGGRVFMVVGIAADAVELITASSAERPPSRRRNRRRRPRWSCGRRRCRSRLRPGCSGLFHPVWHRRGTRRPGPLSSAFRPVR